MKITITAKVDQDVKNAVCQRLSRCKALLDQMFDKLHPFEKYLEVQSMIEIKNTFFNEVNRLCDSLNASINSVLNALDNPALPSDEVRKQNIFPWYDSLQSWAHDSRSFIQNLYAIVGEGNGRYVDIEDIHSLIALQSALHTMERSVWYEIMNKPIEDEFMVCELFKVFDKFKKCYRDNQGAFTRNTKSKFFRSVRCAKGFEAVPLNLYANAFKYLPPDYRKDGVIDVCFNENNDGVLISIASVGPFVEKDLIPTLWEKGVRAESAVMATDEGYGLGLPKVKKLCEQSGFESWIVSEHRVQDAERWGLFTVFIFVPNSAYVDRE